MADGRETLLSPTNVWMFGRIVQDLTIGSSHNPFVKDNQSNNNFLSEQLDSTSGTGPADDKKPNFARIYGFSYGGFYYELETPAIYLVHGPGTSASGADIFKDDASDSAEVAAGKKKNRRLARAPLGISTTGLAVTDFYFADDVMVWAFDKGDFSIRLDVSSGPLEDILLDLEGCDAAPAVAGSKVMGSKVSGSKVSGSKVSGSKVAGSKIRGSKLGD